MSLRAVRSDTDRPLFMSMTYAIYDIATTLAAPFTAAWLAVRPQLRPLLGRFRPQSSRIQGRPLWFQACSVGEATVAAALIERARTRWPQVPILISTSTINGRRRVTELLPDTPSAWFPIDHRASVTGFLKRATPCMLVLVETEIWPNAIRHARQRDIPVVIVNGRISDRHYPRYLRFRHILKPVLSQLSGVAVQNDVYAGRFEALGVPASRIRVTGNTKFEGLVTNMDDKKLSALRDASGLDTGGPIIVFGSTRPGDEALAASCWNVLRVSIPKSRLVVAPRHVERVSEITRLFDEPVRYRSNRNGSKPDARILVVDSLGELVSFYALADIAVIGGSFYPGVNGHNPLEPAALGVPTVFGPYMRNFMDPAEALIKHGGAVQVNDPDQLAPTLVRILNAPAEADTIVHGARIAIAENEGATARTMDFLEEHLTGKGVG